MPDIPAATADYGAQQNAIDLGNSLDRFTNVLAKRYNAEQANQQANQQSAVKAYTDAEVALEVMNAKNVLDGGWSSFSNDLRTDPDHANYINKLNEKSDELWQQIQPLLKLPEAQKQVAEYFAQEKGKQFHATSTLATDKLIGDTETVYGLTRDKYVNSGDPQRLLDLVNFNYEHGTISDTQKEKDLALIPVAKYNNVFAKLLPMDQKSRMDLLNAPDATTRTGLDQSQVDTMAKAYTDRQTMQDAAQKREDTLTNGDIEMNMSDTLVKYMQGGLKATGYNSLDQLYAFVGDQKWQGSGAGDLQAKWVKAFQAEVTRDPTQTELLNTPVMKQFILDMANTEKTDIEKNKIATDLYTLGQINGKQFEYGLDNMKQNSPVLSQELEAISRESNKDINGNPGLLTIQDSVAGQMMLQQAYRDMVKQGPVDAIKLHATSTEIISILSDQKLKDAVSNLWTDQGKSVLGIFTLGGGGADMQGILDLQGRIQNGEITDSLAATPQMQKMLSGFRASQIKDLQSMKIAVDETKVGKDFPAQVGYRQFFYDKAGNAYTMENVSGKKVWKMQKIGQSGWTEVR